jgi:hypothetical protein
MPQQSGAAFSADQTAIAMNTLATILPSSIPKNSALNPVQNNWNNKKNRRRCGLFLSYFWSYFCCGYSVGYGVSQALEIQKLCGLSLRLLIHFLHFPLDIREPLT